VSLTSGRGPLSAHRAGWFNQPVPDGVAYIEPHRRRVRGVLGGETVVDSDRVLLVHHPGRPPAYAFPAADVHGAPTEPEPDAPGYVGVPWDAVDAWFEEEEQVLLHPRNPYHRVECLRSQRRLRVEVADVPLVDTTHTVVLYETALEPRLYVGKDAVRMDLLSPTATTSYCPHKGTASYWRAVVDGVTIEDVAWSYEDPLPECAAIRGHLSFYAERATVITDLPPAPGPGDQPA
jgi:uncharacterized protein (DUF427 family)